MTDTAVDVQQLLLFFGKCTFLSHPHPTPRPVPASRRPPEGLQSCLARWQQVRPPPLWGTVDAREPSRLVFCIRKTQVSWLIVKIVTGQKGQQISSCGPRVVAGVSTGRRKALSSCPCTHFTPRNWASRLSHSGPYIFCRKNRWEHFFYIGNFKTIITLCVKNVQRNL